MPKKWYRDISQYSVVEIQLNRLVGDLGKCLDLSSIKPQIRRLLDSQVPLPQIAFRAKCSIRNCIVKLYGIRRNEIADEEDQEEYIAVARPLIKSLIKEKYLQVYKLTQSLRAEFWTRQNFSLAHQKIPGREQLSPPTNRIPPIQSVEKSSPPVMKSDDKGQDHTVQEKGDSIGKPIPGVMYTRHGKNLNIDQRWRNKSDYRIFLVSPKWGNKSNYRISNDQVLSLWENKSDYRISNQQSYLTLSTWENKSIYRISNQQSYLTLSNYQIFLKLTL